MRQRGVVPCAALGGSPFASPIAVALRSAGNRLAFVTAVVAVLLLASSHAAAESRFAPIDAGSLRASRTLPPAPPRGLGERLPLDLPLTDSQGRVHRLADFVDGKRPVLLVPGYYHCTVLCGVLMQGLLEAYAASGLGAGDARIVGFGLDAHDDAAAAREREALYRGFAERAAALTRRPLADLPLPRLTTASPSDIRRLAEPLGVRYEADAQSGELLHSATFAVLTPDGRVARFFDGVRYEPRDLRLAVVEASQGRLGTLGDRLVLLCGHFDPATGRYSTPVMVGVRVVCGAIFVVLAGWVGWRLRRGRSKAGRSGAGPDASGGLDARPPASAWAAEARTRSRATVREPEARA